MHFIGDGGLDIYWEQKQESLVQDIKQTKGTAL